MTADPLTHGAPLVPLTSPSHTNKGNPLAVIPVLASQPIGMLPWAGAVPSESAEPTCDSTAPPPANSGNHLVGTRILYGNPTWIYGNPTWIEVELVDLPQVGGRSIIG